MTSSFSPILTQDQTLNRIQANITQALNSPSGILSLTASYYASKTGTASSTTPFNFDSKVFDDLNTVIIGTQWKFTVPTGYGGKFLINLQIINNSSYTGYSNIVIYKKGLPFAPFMIFNGNGTAAPICGSGSNIVNLSENDSIDIRALNVNFPWSGNSYTPSAANAPSYITISRVGD